MKHIIILGDGMADHPVNRLGGKTLLQHADIPYIDMIARKGRCGTLSTIPKGFLPGSEVANTAILGYDLNAVYEGRGPLEAASIGYEMRDDDLALRCNIITLNNGNIINHHGGHLTTEEAEQLIDALNAELADDRIQFIKGIQYRHLLVIRGGNKNIICAPPHDHPNEPWQPLLVKAIDDDTNGERCADGYSADNTVRLTATETADIINKLIIKSQAILARHPLNKAREAEGHPTANSIWPWGGGYRPKMQTLQQMYPEVKSGSVISAVDLIKGIGHYAGLDIISVEGATGLANTNYEGKCAAAIEALRHQDFVFLHLEASDEAGHDGDLDLKLKSIQYLDQRIVKPIIEETSKWDEEVAIAVMPDHPTPVEVRTHVDEPVPFAVWHRGIEADSVEHYDEVSCAAGNCGHLHLCEFMNMFMNLK